MKLGVFDSGLGGLVIAKAIRDRLPDHDIVYLGDTKRVPYGDRPAAEIMKFTAEAVDCLFREQECGIVVLACNTASALALRGLQHHYLPEYFPDRRILGVVVPTLEAALDDGRRRIGLLATRRVVESGVYKAELEKIDEGRTIVAQAAPGLVPAIEAGNAAMYRPLLAEYLAPLRAEKVDSVILGCTHYSFLKTMVQEMVGPDIHVLSQDELIPAKLADYLRRHPQRDAALARGAQTHILVTKITQAYRDNAHMIFPDRDIEEITLNDLPGTYEQPPGRPALRLGRDPR